MREEKKGEIFLNADHTHSIASAVTAMVMRSAMLQALLGLAIGVPAAMMGVTLYSIATL